MKESDQISFYLPIILHHLNFTLLGIRNVTNLYGSHMFFLLTNKEVYIAQWKFIDRFQASRRWEHNAISQSLFHFRLHTPFGPFLLLNIAAKWCELSWKWKKKKDNRDSRHGANKDQFLNIRIIVVIDCKRCTMVVLQWTNFNVWFQRTILHFYWIVVVKFSICKFQFTICNL